jgi:hypothetical protein
VLQDQGEFSNTICLHEAKCFYKAVRLGRMTIAEALDLIAVPPNIDAALRAYVRAYPTDAHIISVLEYRSKLAEEVERLVASGRKRCRSELRP